MKNINIGLICIILMFLSSSRIFSQSNHLYFEKINDKAITTNLSDIQKLIFRDGALIVYKKTGDNLTLNLSDIAVLKFQDSTSSGILASDQDLKMRVYPNPINDILYIESEAEMGHVVIVDILGNTIINEYVRSNTIQVDFSHLPKGMYVLKTKENTQKIIKK